MKHTGKKIFMGFLAAALSLSLLTACTSTKNSDKTGDSANQNDSVGQNSPGTSDSSNTGSMSGAGMEVKSVGNFTTQDVNKNTVTQDIFKEHELTMVNVFATW